MATTVLSRNLKLRIDSNLTANAKYNLQRLDELAGIYGLDSTGQVTIRSNSNITIEPEAPAVGGAGIGGSVSIGTAGHSIDISLFGDTEITGTLVVSGGITFGDITSAGVLVSDADGVVTSTPVLPIAQGGTGQATALAARNAILPAQAGNAGRILQTDGTNASWEVPGAGSASMTEHAWAGSNSISIPHGYAQGRYEIAVYDAGGEQVYPTVTIEDSNIVTLTASEVPSGTWRVIFVGA